MGICFGDENCYTRAVHQKGRSLWQPAKPRNAHIRFVRVRSLQRSIAARSVRRWKKSRTWIANARIRSARVERNTRRTHSQCVEEATSETEHFGEVATTSKS